MIEQFLSHCLKDISFLLFPPLCPICGESLPSGFNLFCETCFSNLFLLEKEGRCPRCFGPRESHEACQSCRGLPKGLRQQAACFEESFVSLEVLSLLKKGIGTTAIAGYMVLQLDQLHWPIPDLVVPTPGDWIDKDESWEVRKTLAQEVAKLLDRPYSKSIHLHRSLLPFCYKNLEDQPQTAFPALSSSSEATNKTVLLIHDNYKTGRALCLSAGSLESAGARAVYGLSLVASNTSFFV